VKNYGRLWLLIHDVIWEGREAYEAMLADPLALRARAETLSLEHGLFLLTLFRFDAMVFEAQKLRLLNSFTESYRPASFVEKERQVRERFAQLSMFPEVVDFLQDKFKGEPYDQGYPEHYPAYEVEPSGVVVLRSSSKYAWEAS